MPFVRSQLAAPNTGCPRELTLHTRTRLPYTPPLAPPNRYSGRAPALSHVPALRATAVHVGCLTSAVPWFESRCCVSSCACTQEQKPKMPPFQARDYKPEMFRSDHPTRCRAGVTQQQYDHLTATQERFTPNPGRINNFNNPMQNTVDRNWQERLRTDPGYRWNRSDQQAYSRNSSFGPHNAAEQLERRFYP
jgi:hypothetical protein